MKYMYIILAIFITGLNRYLLGFKYINNGLSCIHNMMVYIYNE